ncbi:hypothetical protein BJX99DRAFT_231646 [Aspergillus californicus]
MKLLSIVPLLACLPALSSAYVTIGSTCSGAQYDCSTTYDIATCNGRNWQLAADCGSLVCIMPAGESPRCA